MTYLHDTDFKPIFTRNDLLRELLEVFAPAGLTELPGYSTLRPEKGSKTTTIGVANFSDQTSQIQTDQLT